MTTTYPDHEHPQYVTHADLEAFEGRIINRLVELELRIERRLHEQLRWTIGLILPVYALVLGVILTIVIFGFNIMATQAAILSKLP
jgi:hypothetical protein